MLKAGSAQVSHLLSGGPKILEVSQDCRGGSSPAVEPGALRVKNDPALIEEEC